MPFTAIRWFTFLLLLAGTREPSSPHRSILPHVLRSPRPSSAVQVFVAALRLQMLPVSSAPGPCHNASQSAHAAHKICDVNGRDVDPWSTVRNFGHSSHMPPIALENVQSYIPIVPDVTTAAKSGWSAVTGDTSLGAGERTCTPSCQSELLMRESERSKLSGRWRLALCSTTLAQCGTWARRSATSSPSHCASRAPGQAGFRVLPKPHRLPAYTAGVLVQSREGGEPTPHGTCVSVLAATHKLQEQQRQQRRQRQEQQQQQQQRQQRQRRRRPQMVRQGGSSRPSTAARRAPWGRGPG